MKAVIRITNAHASGEDFPSLNQLAGIENGDTFVADIIVSGAAEFKASKHHYSKENGMIYPNDNLFAAYDEYEIIA